MYKKNNFSFLRITTLALAVFTFTKTTTAQDIHFSQFDETPVQLNPATVGVQHEIRGILNFKNQWQSIGSPYRTYAFSFDARLLKNKKLTQRSSHYQKKAFTFIHQNQKLLSQLIFVISWMCLVLATPLLVLPHYALH